MKLRQLRVANFAAIGSLDIEFGPGLNVLYGPNDLGKSTVAAAIRLGLLLPHNSTHCEPYVSWTGTGDPMVEMTFETEAQRIWRVRKQFGRTGSALLQESRNGRDFSDLERGRSVDAKLREILRWGIPEPGGAGGARGLPTSFLATVLLSPQDDVSAVLGESLRNDATGSGKEQIANALQAVAQDPKFVALLRKTQEKRDEAYTDKGAKKTAKGSIFRAAADRLNEARREKETLERIVADSEGAEKQLRELMDKRTSRQEALAAATALAAECERLAGQAKCRAVAEEQVRLAREEVARIQKIGAEVEAAERKVGELVRKITAADQALGVAREQQTAAVAALHAAEEAARAAGPDSATADTVVRQQLEIRKSAAEQAMREAQQRIEALGVVKKLADAAAGAGEELGVLEAAAKKAVEAATKAEAASKTADDELRRCDLLERALDVQAADKQVAEAKVRVENEAVLRGRLEAASGQRAVLAGQRSAITVPPSAGLRPMRALATERAAARGALDVGFVVTVNPNDSLDLHFRKDAQEIDSRSIAEPLEIEAKAEVELAIGSVATVHVRGGRREAQEKARRLEVRWRAEVEPHLLAAGVADLPGLEAKVAEGVELDAGIKATDAELESLRAQMAALGGAAEALSKANSKALTCRAALGDARMEALAKDLKALGADPAMGLRKRRVQLSKACEEARAAASKAATVRTIADERTKQGRLALEAAVKARDEALAAFPEGVAAALAAAKAALAAGGAEKEKVAAELASLVRTIEARKKQMDAALEGARTNAAKAASAVEGAQRDVTAATAEHASHEGRLIELRKQREAENLAEAESRLREAAANHEALPVPVRLVSEAEVAAAQGKVAFVKAELEGVEREIHRGQGALEQVGGAVARERLRDATEAFELAERQEREMEAEYEAWRLLLEQMKEADAAQASNLGQALAPAIAGRFQELTRRRYETVRLTAQLETEGVVVAGALRPHGRISVGTREQLSTLYRLSLAEYLGTVIVLDDQLVQSDESRMGWFRELLQEKSRSFQIVVLTCRPGDYLGVSGMGAAGGEVQVDTEGGYTRAVDLGRAIQRR